MKGILKQHAEATTKYSMAITRIDGGYVQGGAVHTSDHEVLGYTADSIAKMIGYITNPNYAYARQKNGYIVIYALDSKSPTGVSSMGGIPTEMEFLLYAFGKPGQLSPTEDLRTAH